MEGRLNRMPYLIPSGPGLDLWFAAFRTPKISLGRIGDMLKSVKLSSPGQVWISGNQCVLLKSVTVGVLYEL